MCCHSWDRKELNKTEQLNKQLALLGESGNPRVAHLLEFTSCWDIDLRYLGKSMAAFWGQGGEMALSLASLSSEDRVSAGGEHCKKPTPNPASLCSQQFVVLSQGWKFLNQTITISAQVPGHV